MCMNPISPAQQQPEKQKTIRYEVMRRWNPMLRHSSQNAKRRPSHDKIRKHRTKKKEEWLDKKCSKSQRNDRRGKGMWVERSAFHSLKDRAESLNKYIFSIHDLSKNQSRHWRRCSILLLRNGWERLSEKSSFGQKFWQTFLKRVIYIARRSTKSINTLPVRKRSVRTCVLWWGKKAHHA